MQVLAFTKEAIIYLRSSVAQDAALLKNSGAVTAGAMTTAVFGFIYWWLAARSFPPEVIGRASAILSLMGFAGLLGEGGFGTLLAGEIVCHPGRERGLIGAAALVTTALSFAVGALLLTLSDFTSELFSGMGANQLAGLWFILGCALTGLSLVLDQAFVGMLQSKTRMIRQFVFSITKLALIAVVAWRSGDVALILFTWVASQFISLVVVEILLRRGGGSLLRRPDFGLLRALERKVVGHYMLDVSVQAPSTVLPYLVTVLLSAKSNAAFSSIWMVLLVASIVPAALSTVLFPVLRVKPDQYREKMLLSLGVSLAFAIAFSSFVFTYSTDILRLFNPAYAEIAGSSLRFLGFGLIGAVIKFHICAAARLTNNMLKASVWFSVGGLFELACVTAGCIIAGLEGLSISWATAILIEAVAMFFVARRAIQWMPPYPSDASTADGATP